MKKSIIALTFILTAIGMAAISPEAPQEYEIHFFAAGDGDYDLEYIIDDQLHSQKYQHAVTEIDVKTTLVPGAEISFQILPAQDSLFVSGSLSVSCSSAVEREEVKLTGMQKSSGELKVLVPECNPNL
jgi:hypothetical protein